MRTFTSENIDIHNICENIALLNGVSLGDYVSVFYFIFLVGLSGTIFNWKNYLIAMLNIELMYLGIVALFIVASLISRDIKGQIYGLILLILAASESAVGLGILIVLFRFRRTVNFSAYQELRG
jgi:NADH-quinone oxidoreductase subunit K